MMNNTVNLVIEELVNYGASRPNELKKKVDQINEFGTLMDIVFVGFGAGEYDGKDFSKFMLSKDNVSLDLRSENSYGSQVGLYLISKIDKKNMIINSPKDTLLFLDILFNRYIKLDMTNDDLYYLIRYKTASFYTRDLYKHHFIGAISSIKVLIYDAMKESETCQESENQQEEQQQEQQEEQQQEQEEQKQAPSSAQKGKDKNGQNIIKIKNTKTRAFYKNGEPSFVEYTTDVKINYNKYSKESKQLIKLMNSSLAIDEILKYGSIELFVNYYNGKDKVFTVSDERGNMFMLDKNGNYETVVTVA